MTSHLCLREGFPGSQLIFVFAFLCIELFKYLLCQQITILRFLVDFSLLCYSLHVCNQGYAFPEFCFIFYVQPKARESSIRKLSNAKSPLIHFELRWWERRILCIFKTKYQQHQAKIPLPQLTFRPLYQ